MKLCINCSNKIHQGKKTKQHQITDYIPKSSRNLENLIEKSSTRLKQAETSFKLLKEKVAKVQDSQNKLKTQISNQFIQMEKIIEQKRNQLILDYVDSKILYDIKEIENYLRYFDYCIQFTQKVNNNPTIGDEDFIKIQKMIDERLKILSEKEWKSPINVEKNFNMELFTTKMNQIGNQLKNNLTTVEKNEDIVPKVNKVLKTEAKTEMESLKQNWKTILEEWKEIETKTDKLKDKTLVHLKSFSDNMKLNLKPNNFTSLTDNVVQFYEAEKLYKYLSKERDTVVFGSQFIKSNL